MPKWLSPTDIQETFRIGKTQSYDLLKKYKEGGGQYIRIGRLTRVPQDSFETYLLKETEKYQNETGS